MRRGHRVVATADRVEDLWSLVDEYGTAVMAIELDVDDESADRKVVSRVIEVLGRLDVVVNNAGSDRLANSEDLRYHLERAQTSLFGALWISQAALTHMCANSGGRIVQVYGTMGSVDSPSRGLFERHKRVLDEFSEHLAREVAPFGVEVTVCVPEELYCEWIETNPPRTYTVSPYEAKWQ